MARFVLFLRAVNVARRSVPMAPLRERLAGRGLGNVASYIQSGNLLVDARAGCSAEEVAALVEEVVARDFGVATTAILRTPAELTQLVELGEALPDPIGPGSRRYAALARDEFAAAAAELLDGWSVAGERAKVCGRECYLWFAIPFHAARLSNARIERAGAVATTRDWKVLTALAQRWGEPPPR